MDSDQVAHGRVVLWDLGDPQRVLGIGRAGHLELNPTRFGTVEVRLVVIPLGVGDEQVDSYDHRFVDKRHHVIIGIAEVDEGPLGFHARLPVLREHLGDPARDVPGIDDANVPTPELHVPKSWPGLRGAVVLNEADANRRPERRQRIGTQESCNTLKY